MTLDEFYQKLSDTADKYDWTSEAFGKPTSLRGNTRPDQEYEYHCPISAVTGNDAHLGAPEDAAIGILGMTAQDAWTIIHAADYNTYEIAQYRPEVRAKLLEALGLA